MSFDPNQDMPPMGHVAPKKSGGSLKWILGGLGCFGLLTICCFGAIGFGVFGIFQGMTANPAYLDARTTLENSQSLADVVGEPVTVGEPTGPPGQSQNGQRITFVYSVPVSGPDASGTATIKVEGQLFTDDWNLEELTAEVDGVDVPIEDNVLDIKIEGEEDMGDGN